MENTPLIPSRLPESIRTLIDYSLAKPTRIHPLPSKPKSGIWIKREDELSSGISGSKLRKYASLLPYLKKQEVEVVAMIGGPNSNNLVGLAQLLKENAIKPIAYIRQAGDSRKQGNALLLDMLLKEDETRFVAREDWSEVEAIANRELQNGDFRTSKSHLLLEGCFGTEGIPGAMTLAEDILRNESEEKTHFERIYIDCGTGLTAMGLILGLELLEDPKQQREIAVTLIAEEENMFLSKLSEIRKKLDIPFPEGRENRNSIRFLKPTLSPKFGSISASLFKCCRDIAKTEGIIMDPTYSVKHYATMQEDLRTSPLEKPCLFINNGSPLGTMGFQGKLQLI